MQREIKSIKTIPQAHLPEDVDGNPREEWKAPPNCPSCKRYGIERNDCDYYETEETTYFFKPRKYLVKTYAYFCGHYRNISREL